ncbi:MAG: 30S ribosomal protein S16 [Actinomycetota bacterium]
MVRIRLMRVGKRKQPAYRVVVADARSPRDGRIIEAIGHYQPLADPSLVSIDGERAVYWLRQGAQPSNQVRNLLRISGAWSEFTGEAPPPSADQPAAPKPRKVKATVAASVEESDAPAESADAPEEAEASPDEA